MKGYDRWHNENWRLVPRHGTFVWEDVNAPDPPTYTTNHTTPIHTGRERDALIYIAYDCPTLDAAQRRAREALKEST